MLKKVLLVKPSCNSDPLGVACVASTLDRAGIDYDYLNPVDYPVVGEAGLTLPAVLAALDSDPARIETLRGKLVLHFADGKVLRQLTPWDGN